MDIFAKRLKEIREEHGYSQHELAKAIGGNITNSAISLWELGKRIPRFDAVIVLAKFFKVSTDYFAGFED